MICAARLPKIFPVVTSICRRGLRSSRCRAANLCWRIPGSGAISAPKRSSARVTGDIKTESPWVSAPRQRGPEHPVPHQSTRRCPLKSPWISHAFFKPASLPPPLAAIRLPGRGSLLRKGSIEVCHGFESRLSRRAGEETIICAVNSIDTKSPGKFGEIKHIGRCAPGTPAKRTQDKTGSGALCLVLNNNK